MKLSTLLITSSFAFNIAVATAVVRAHPETFGLGASEAKAANHLPAAAEQGTVSLIDSEKPKGLALNTKALTRSAEAQSYILDTIRANPQAVVDALEAYQAQLAQERRQAALQAPRSGLKPAREKSPIIAPVPETREYDTTAYVDPENTENAHVSGNLEGDITIVEFFDYNCGHCRKTTPIVSDVVKADGNIRIIYREFPILGQDSVFAAKASLASREQGLYEAFHEELMSYGSLLNEEAVMEIAINTGLDIEQLREDMKDPKVIGHIKTTLELADQFDFKGTPSFVIGGVPAPGAPTKEELTSFIADLRSR